MLNLLLGPAGSGKTEFLLEKLINYSDNNIVNSDILIILPSRAACDSFIHQFDKTPILGLNIETFRSFSLRIIENENIGLKPLNYGFTYSFCTVHRPQKGHRKSGLWSSTLRLP